MAEPIDLGCTRPGGGPEEEAAPEANPDMPRQAKEVTPMIQVGKKAPEFTATAYLNGNFVQVKLSEYLGKWVILCFYPGDFTFV